jgi:MSHA biogenesis protein MshK
MADRLIRCLALLCFALPAAAQSVLADPTRPPFGAAGDPGAAGEVSGPVLQSVKIPKKGKPIAVIGGQQVVLGKMYGDSRLTSLTESEAVLEGPAGIERLRLTPGIEKTNIVVKKPVAANGQRRGKP